MVWNHGILWLSISIQLGISWSQLTFTPSFFRGVGGSTTNTRYALGSWVLFHRQSFCTDELCPDLPGMLSWYGLSSSPRKRYGKVIPEMLCTPLQHGDVLKVMANAASIAQLRRSYDAVRKSDDSPLIWGTCFWEGRALKFFLFLHGNITQEPHLLESIQWGFKKLGPLAWDGSK